MLISHSLTKADTRKLEDALNTNDLEVMVATVERIVALRINAALRSTVTAPAAIPKPR